MSSESATLQRAVLVVFKPLTALLFLLWLLSQGCFRPVEGDFPHHGQGLEDDELLWVLRIPANSEDAGIKEVSMRERMANCTTNPDLRRGASGPASKMDICERAF